MYHSNFAKGCLIILSSFVVTSTNAQSKPGDTWTDAEGTQWELQGAATDNQQKADYNGSPSSQKDKFDGGWFFRAFKFIQWAMGIRSDEITTAKEYPEDSRPLVPAQKARNFLSVGIGLGLSQKGQKASFPGGSSSTTIYYLDIPALKARYHLRMADASTLFFDLSPYYAIALGGHSKFLGSKTGLKFGNSAGDNFRRGDFGIQLGGAYRWKTQPFYAGLVYDYGIANIAPSTGTGFKFHNRSFGVQIGRYFK